MVRRPRVTVAAVVVAVMTSTAACTGTSGTDASTGGASVSASVASPSPTPTPTPAKVVVSIKDGAKGVEPSAPISVTATSGTLSDVVVTSVKGGHVLEGTQSGPTWTATSRPRPGTAYRITATAKGSDGTPLEQTSTFSTLTPKITATYHLVYDGETVGVGMPVSVQFDSAVKTQAQRAEVERNVKVTTVPEQAGAWGWLDNRQLMWRPESYWKPGTKVSVDAALTGLQTGDGKWVANDAEGGFTVGSAMVSTVDIAGHTMTVTRNGKTLRTLPISAGRNDDPRWVTRSGTKVIITKEADVVMDSASIGVPKGDPDYYQSDVQWGLRVTWTGEYLHSAPWSVGAQGNANVSHGCVNLSPSNAKWMFDASKVGDIVVFKGSKRPFIPTEGIGVWEYSWTKWQKQSALA